MKGTGGARLRHQKQKYRSQVRQSGYQFFQLLPGRFDEKHNNLTAPCSIEQQNETGPGRISGKVAKQLGKPKQELPQGGSV